MQLEIGLFEKEKKERKKKRKEKKKKNPTALSLGYPNSYFYNKRCNMLLFIMSKNMEHSSEKIMPRELKERFTNFTHL